MSAMPDYRCPTCDEGTSRRYEHARCRQRREAGERLAEANAQRRWFKRTGHCGGCAQPSSYCLCTDKQPCGCRNMHTMGGGLRPDALNQFAETMVSDDQQELFG